MFENAGGKLKVCAKIIFVFFIVLNSILGIILSGYFSGTSEYNFLGFIIGLITGTIIGWLSSILLFAFGELCENVYYIRHESTIDEEDEENEEDDETEINNKLFDESNTQEQQEPEICPRCCQFILNEYGVCMKCGYEKDDD